MKKGFTVLEFLVILGILAVVGTVFVFLLNPAERMREARDAQRIIDITELKKAISLYLTIVEKPDLDARGNCENEYKSTNGSVAVDGSGWLPINFDLMPGGSTLSKLPIDPINDATHYYSYKCNPTGLKFELNAKMESERYNSSTGSL